MNGKKLSLTWINNILHGDRPNHDWHKSGGGVILKFQHQKFTNGWSSGCCGQICFSWTSISANKKSVSIACQTSNKIKPKTQEKNTTLLANLHNPWPRAFLKSSQYRDHMAHIQFPHFLTTDTDKGHLFCHFLQGSQEICFLQELFPIIKN